MNIRLLEATDWNVSWFTRKRTRKAAKLATHQSSPFNKCETFYSRLVWRNHCLHSGVFLPIRILKMTATANSNRAHCGFFRTCTFEISRIMSIILARCAYQHAKLKTACTSERLIKRTERKFREQWKGHVAPWIAKVTCYSQAFKKMLHSTSIGDDFQVVSKPSTVIECAFEKSL